MHKNNNIKPYIFTRRVLKWFEAHGRKTLPWQLGITPFRVWISEIMLQQTQVKTVIPYFERFMARFATITALADADLDEVLHLWTGLGYYSRARNLHKTAAIIKRDFAGNFPDTLEKLMALPGIGKSTAGAILAIGFGHHAAILDGNVKRVLCRFYGITTWPGLRATHDELWAIAERLTPVLRVGEYTQAMMDLGATVCVRGKPLCALCPLEQDCSARRAGVEKALPVKKPKVTLPVRLKTFLIVHDDKKVFLQKRPASGIWGGLWSFPELLEHVDLATVKTFCLTHRFKATRTEFGKVFRHTFSHYHLDILPVRITVRSSLTIQDGDTSMWFDLTAPPTVGLPAPIANILKQLRPIEA